LGLILAVVVHSAGIQDRDGAKLLLWRIAFSFPRLRLIWADGGYAGELVGWVKNTFGWILRIRLRPQEARGFVVIKRRWVVERTFGWLGRFRRLSKDYEFLTDSSETMVYLAMTHLMLRRLAPRPK
jgi:putative transposase